MTDTQIEQLTKRVAALERLAQTRDILDNTEALAARQRQQVEQAHTDLLAKLDRVQDEHGVLLTRLDTKADGLADKVDGVSNTLAAFVEEQRRSNAALVELLSNLVGKDPNAG